MADLPAFNPEADPERPHPAVAHLREQLTAADAVLFCMPEYAGTLPGSLKNLLDWTVGVLADVLTLMVEQLGRG